MIEKASDSARIAEAASATGEVFFVPAFSGLYAPYWRKDARRYGICYSVSFGSTIVWITEAI